MPHKQNIYVFANQLIEHTLCKILKSFPLKNSDSLDNLNNSIVVADLDDYSTKMNLSGKRLLIPLIGLSFTPAPKARIDSRLTVFDCKQSYFLRKPFKINSLESLLERIPENFYQIYSDNLLNLIWHAKLFQTGIKTDMPSFPWLLQMIYKHFPSTKFFKSNIDQEKLMFDILPIMAKQYIFTLYADFYHEKANSGLEGYISKILEVTKFYLNDQTVGRYDTAKNLIKQNLFDNAMAKELLEKSYSRLDDLENMFSNNYDEIQNKIDLFKQCNIEITKGIIAIDSNIKQFISDSDKNNKLEIANKICEEAEKISTVLKSLNKNRETIRRACSDTTGGSSCNR